jgi:hypothetical protein
MAYKIIESPTGIGEVLMAGQHLCKVHYQLQHREDTRTGQAEIFGQVTVNETERMSVQVLNAMQSGQVFTLRLADNRSLQVSFTRGDALSGTYRAVNSSPEGFKPAS